jgi:hypothetical protein
MHIQEWGRFAMNTNKWICIAKTAVITILSPWVAFGQSKVGTTAFQFLKIEPSARASAMGNASTSLGGEAMAAYYNPASLGRLNQSDVQFTYSRWLADIEYSFATVAVRIERVGTLLLGMTSLNSGEIDVRTVEQPLGTGERYSMSNFALGMGYGRMLTDRVSVGIQLNYLHESIWHSSVSGFSINMGVQYQFYQNGPTLGASVSNFGPRTQYSGRDLYIDYDFDPTKYGDNDQLPAELRTNSYSLPTLFRVGISFPWQPGMNHQITMAVDALHPNDNQESLQLGAEWMAFRHFFLRGGFRDLFLDDREGGLVLGGGMELGFAKYSFRFDYAWTDYARLDETHRLTIGFGF